MSQAIPADLDPSKKRYLTRWQRIAASKFLIISIAVHLLVGVGATFYIVQRYSEKRKMTFTGGPPTTNPSKRALEHKVALGKKSKSMGAPAQAKRIAVNAPSKVSLPDIPTLSTATEVLPNRMAGLGGFGSGFGAGGGGGMGGGGGGGGGGINFFGLRSAGKSFVICVDISGSMVTGKKNVGSYETLEKEVIKVIKGLQPMAKFGLVAFSGEAHVYKTQLMEARPDEKERASNWLKKQSPAEYVDPKASEADKAKHRGTRADLALERAFDMKPDVIFFVSDGEPSGGATAEGCLKIVQDEQKKMPKPAIVNSIAYMADSGQAFMKNLAEQNKGTFREVNP